MYSCLECNNQLEKKIFEYSIQNFGIPLCLEHQKWIKYMNSQTTQETMRLYFALKERGVPAEMEKFDGYKHIDIAIPEAKVNIEVDGGHHNFNTQQALADLRRTYYSFLKGYITFRIPNSLVYNDKTLEETADYIVEMLNENNKRNYHRRF